MTPHAELDQLSAYIDGELEPQERTAVDAHLPTCAECRTTLDALRATITDLGTLPEPAPTEQDSWALRAAIARARKPTVRRWQRMVVAAGSVAAVGIGIAAFVFSGGGADKALERSRNADTALSAGGTVGAPVFSSSENFTLVQAHQHFLEVSGKLGSAKSRNAIPAAEGQALNAPAEFAAAAPSDTTQQQIDRCVAVVKRSTQQLLTPFRYEVVTFEKKPAFFLIFSTTERFELWIVTRDRCDVLYFEQTA